MKKRLSLVLVMCMFLAIFVGCSPNEGPGSESSLDHETESTKQTEQGGDPEVHMLDGKKILFIGNSYTYYGKTVLEKKQSVQSQEARSNDQGYFYQLCKANGANVSVTNWTYGAHDFEDLFVNCTANRGCNGVDHLADLTDRNFDYVILQNGNGGATWTNEYFMQLTNNVMNIFKETNPDVKFVFLVQHSAYTNNYTWLPMLKELHKNNVTIVDWGSLVYDVFNGVTKVPNATLEYTKNTFIISKSASDGYHPNMLTGYITTLMTYCAITGEGAVGQPYDFCGDTTINPVFSFKYFISQYYTYNKATTNFPDVFASAEDMNGIQQLINQYLADKGYLNY